MKTVFVAGVYYALPEIARMTDLSVEELELCNRNELVDIILDYLER